VKHAIAAAAFLLLTGCAGEDGRPGPLTSMFCGMRESACEQRCKEMDGQSQVACRRSCADSARDKCS